MPVIKYEKDPNAAATLFANLFILLLAFFVVLFALSEIVDERVDKAIDSIAEVFSITIDATEDLIETPQNRASGLSNDFILNLVKTIIESQVKVLEPLLIKSNPNRLFVRYSLIDLFQTNSSFLRPDKLIILRRIAHSVSQAVDPVYVVVTVNAPINELGNNFSFGVPTPALRANHLIELLLQEGLPDHLIQALISNEEGQFVEFKFYTKGEDLPSIKIVPKEYGVEQQDNAA